MFTSCNSSQEQTTELLIYCGTTMVRPITEIAKEIEKKENCKIHIVTGGSGDLLKSIISNKQGDLYLPGSESYILYGTKENIITDTVFVGENRVVIMVKKGEKEKIKGNNFCSLRDKELRIVIANPYSSSIGKESKRILEKKGIYNEVATRISFFGADSKDLFLAVKENRADLAINWYAPYVWDNNKDFIDVIEIDSIYRDNKRLTLGVLSYSKHPKLAKKVLDLAHSDKGKQIFSKYGF